MKLAFRIHIKQQDFLETTPTLRSTWTFRLSSIAILLHILTTLPLGIFFWSKLPPMIPLWYSKPWGNERLVPPWYLLFPFAVSLITYGVNIFVANKIGVHHPMFARVLFLTSALVSVISAIIIIRSIFLVT
jgi:hypothetical protein